MHITKLGVNHKPPKSILTGRKGRISSSSTEAAAEKGAIYIGHGVLDSLLNYLGALDFCCFFCWGSTCLVPRDLGEMVAKRGVGGVWFAKEW